MGSSGSIVQLIGTVREHAIAHGMFRAIRANDTVLPTEMLENQIASV